VAWLGVIVFVVIAEVMCISCPFELQRWFFRGGLLLPFAVAVWFVVLGIAVISVHPHGTVAVEGMVGAFRFIHRYLVMVYTQAVTLGVTIGEQSALKHFVGRETDPRDNVCGVESSLLHILEIVVGVAVQFELAHRNEWEVFLRPDFGKVKGMEPVGFGLFFGHHLDTHFPFGELLPFDGIEEIALRRLAVYTDQFGRFLIR